MGYRQDTKGNILYYGPPEMTDFFKQISFAELIN